MKGIITFKALREANKIIEEKGEDSFEESMER